MKYGLYSGLFLVMGFTLISFIRGMVYQYKLFRYLFEHHNEKWKYLTSGRIFGYEVGPGFRNSMRALPFLFDNDDMGDPEVLRLKVIVRNSFLYFIIGGPATFICAFITFTICSKL
jgi:hypothetical protein